MIRLNRIYKELSIAMEGLKKGVLEIAITTSENAQVAKLLFRIFELEKKTDKLYIDIGKMIYELRHLPYQEILDHKEIKIHINTIRTTRQDIQDIEKEIKLLREDNMRFKLDELTRYMRRGGYTVEELIVEKDSAACGKKLGELRLPTGVIILSVISHDLFVLPEAGRLFNAGDRVFILGSRDRIKETASLFTAPVHFT